MSIIVPAGNKNVKWSPEDETLTKTASTSAPVDALYDAAKKVVTAQFEEEKKEEGEKVEGENVEKKDNPFAEIKDVATGEKTEKEAVENIQEKVKDLQVAVQEAAVAVGAEESVEVEVEVENEKPEVDEISIEVEPEKDTDLMVESKPVDACACRCDKCKKTPCECKKDEKKEDVEAAVAEQFYKFGKISADTRKKITEFWKNDLGYPADYVSLMVKDYEK